MITAQIQSARTQGALNQLARQLADRQVVNHALSLKMFQMVQDNFESESFDGDPWVDLAPSTRRWKEKRGYEMILQNTGALRQSFLPFSDNTLAGVGAQSMASVVAGDPPKAKRPRDLAKIHEEGIGVPQRRMLPSRARALEEAVSIYGYFVARAAQRVGR